MAMWDSPNQMFGGFGANTNYGGGSIGVPSPMANSGTLDTSGGGGWGGVMGNFGNLIGQGLNLYGGYQNMQNQNNLTGAVNNGFMMAGGAYNPQMFGMQGVGGTGFSVSSPTNGGPGSIHSTLGVMDPMYGQYARQGSQFMGQAGNLANNAAGGAQQAYQNSLASIMPQLQQMQGNLLAANNNSLFERGQLGSGSYGQMGAGGNPVNLTTQSLGAGFAQQDLNAITAAQNQGLNFFNSNISGANTLGNLGMNATNTGLGMINAQNALAQNPLAYAGLVENSKLGAGGNMASMVKAANNNGQAFSSGLGAFGQNFAGGGGSGGMGSMLSSLNGMGNGLDSILGGSGSWMKDIGSMFGFSGAGGQAAVPASDLASMRAGISQDLGVNPASGGSGMSAMQGVSALNAGMDIMGDIKNWQSGATGKDTLMGAKTGWDVGNTIVPGIGGVIGAPIGAAAGAISSAFGGGIRSQESKNWLDYTKQFNSLSPQQQQQYGLSMPVGQAIQGIQGVMNAHNNSPGHSEGIEQVWGRNNAQGFVDSLAGELNSAVKSGKIKPGESVQDQFKNVIAPWLASKHAGIDPNAKTSGGFKEGQALQLAIENVMGNYEMGNLTGNTAVGVKGQTLQGLPKFVGG